MKHYQGPLDIPCPIANQLTQLVTAFAKQHKLRSEPWYHDAPNWFVIQDSDDIVVGL